MFKFLKNLIGGGSNPPKESVQPTEASGPSVERSRIIEGSPTPTYLKLDADLERTITRLYGLGVRILYGEAEDQNLVNELREGLRTGALPELTQVTQYLAKQTIDKLAKMSDPELADRVFVMGEVEPSDLLRARSMSEFVKRLTLGYPGHEVLVGEFDSTAVVGTNLSNRVFDQGALNALLAPRATSVGAESDGRSRFDLMRIVTESLQEAEEAVSYGRLKFLNPYIPGIANCPADRRYEIVRRIFADEYPYDRANQENWHSEIGSAMSHHGY